MSDRPPRRVVVGTDEQGYSTITADAPAACSFEVGPAAMHQLWLTTTTPAELDVDALSRSAPTVPFAQPPAGGSLFQVCTFHPGAESPLHRTDTVDYVYVADGTIEMDTHDGGTVRLSAGDCLVQLATVHRWANRSAAPCTLVVTCLSTKTDPGAALDIELAGEV